MNNAGITFNTLHQLINFYVESNIITGDVGSGEDMQYNLQNIIDLCSDLKYHVRNKTGADY